MQPPDTPTLFIIEEYTTRVCEIYASYTTGGVFRTGSVGEIKALAGELPKLWEQRRDEIAKVLNPDAANRQKVVIGQQRRIRHDSTSHLQVEEVSNG